MPDVGFETAKTLLVASRGTADENGLFRWTPAGVNWRGRHLARVNQLSALARHPHLAVVYGTSGVRTDGFIHAWRLAGGDVMPLSSKPSEGADPCHLVVDPTGTLLIVTNYGPGRIALQRLAADGSFDGPISLVRLEGSGPEAARQDTAHPHQALFHDGHLYVVDLGADALREFTVDLGRGGEAALVAGRITALPSGSGPRHAVVLPDGRFAISGELGSSLLVGRPGDPLTTWASVPSTKRTGPAATRSPRNYPGDIQRSADGRHVYLANRGYDTIACFDVSGAVPVLVAERDAGGAWPQHLLVDGGRLLVACWDSGRVMAMPLVGGVPGEAAALFDCAGAGWLLPA